MFLPIGTHNYKLFFFIFTTVAMFLPIGTQNYKLFFFNTIHLSRSIKITDNFITNIVIISQSPRRVIENNNITLFPVG